MNRKTLELLLINYTNINNQLRMPCAEKSKFEKLIKDVLIEDDEQEITEVLDVPICENGNSKWKNSFKLLGLGNAEVEVEIAEVENAVSTNPVNEGTIPAVQRYRNKFIRKEPKEIDTEEVAINEGNFVETNT